VNPSLGLTLLGSNPVGAADKPIRVSAAPLNAHTTSTAILIGNVYNPIRDLPAPLGRQTKLSLRKSYK
jgi:hypothetical protein